MNRSGLRTILTTLHGTELRATQNIGTPNRRG